MAEVPVKSGPPEVAVIERYKVEVEVAVIERYQSKVVHQKWLL